MSKEKHLLSVVGLIKDHGDRFNELAAKHNSSPLSGEEDVELVALNTARSLLLHWALDNVQQISLVLADSSEVSANLLWLGRADVTQAGNDEPLRTDVGVASSSDGKPRVFYLTGLGGAESYRELNDEAVSNWSDDLCRPLSHKLAVFIRGLMKFPFNKSLPGGKE